MARIIKTDGTITELDKNPTLEEEQKIVGGWVEIYRTDIEKDRSVVMDEEGRLKNALKNRVASDEVGFPIYGDVIIMEGLLQGDSDD